VVAVITVHGHAALAVPSAALLRVGAYSSLILATFSVIIE